jgi:hypothetical protein
MPATLATPEDAPRAPVSEPFCGAQLVDESLPYPWTCTAAAGHEGGHVAYGGPGVVTHRFPATKGGA